MKQSFMSITILQPQDGYMLTNGEIYTSKAYLGVNDSILNWSEVPIEEVPEQEEENIE